MGVDLEDGRRESFLEEGYGPGASPEQRKAGSHPLASQLCRPLWPELLDLIWERRFYG